MGHAQIQPRPLGGEVRPDQSAEVAPDERTLHSFRLRTI